MVPNSQEHKLISRGPVHYSLRLFMPNKIKNMVLNGFHISLIGHSTQQAGKAIISQMNDYLDRAAHPVFQAVKKRQSESSHRWKLKTWPARKKARAEWKLGNHKKALFLYRKTFKGPMKSITIRPKTITRFPYEMICIPHKNLTRINFLLIYIHTQKTQEEHT